MQYTKYQTNQNVIQALFVCPPPASFSGGLGRTLLRPCLSANLARDWRPPALPAEGISEQPPCSAILTDDSLAKI